MDILYGLVDLFFSCISTVLSGGYWIVLLMVISWAAALVFNVIHILMGGR